MGRGETHQADTGAVAQPDLEPAIVELVVRRMLGDVSACIEQWEATPLTGGRGGARVYRTTANPLALIDSLEGQDLLALVATPEMRAGVGRLLHERERLLQGLSRLPRTFCHRDAWPPNIFLPSDGDPVAIDWEFAGVGAVGEDVGSLVVGMQNMNDIPVAQQERAERLIFDAYLAGLRSAGWCGDARLARLGCTTFVALLDVAGIYSTVVVLFGSTAERELDALYQGWIGLTAREAAGVIRELFTLMFQLGDEALRLMDELGM